MYFDKYRLKNHFSFCRRDGFETLEHVCFKRVHSTRDGCLVRSPESDTYSTQWTIIGVLQSFLKYLHTGIENFPLVSSTVTGFDEYLQSESLFFYNDC